MRSRLVRGGYLNPKFLLVLLKGLHLSAAYPVGLSCRCYLLAFSSDVTVRLDSSHIRKPRCLQRARCCQLLMQNDSPPESLSAEAQSPSRTPHSRDPNRSGRNQNACDACRGRKIKVLLRLLCRFVLHSDVQGITHNVFGSVNMYRENPVVAGVRF
jgi:hypothetical protein